LNFTFGSGAKIEELNTYGDNEEIEIGLERSLLKKFHKEYNWIKKNKILSSN
jgi:hypothetical protein